MNDLTSLSGDSSDLRLGAVGLASKDVAYIRALVRLFTHTEKLGWTFADHPPYDAVVAERGGREADLAAFDGFQGPVLTLVDPPGMPEADTVAYPIHANQFRDWLALRQETLSRARAAASATHGGVPEFGERRFKLRRWPAASLLQGDPLHTRIATFMSRSAVSLPQLAALTGRPPEACLGFLTALHAAGMLVEAAATAPASTARNDSADAVAPVPTPAAQARPGLMASLRRHLGL